MKRGFAMKKLLIVLMLLLCLLPAASLAEKAVFQGKFTADTEAEAIDLGKVRVENMDAFIAYLRKFPNLKKVDMFSTNLYTKDIDKLAAAFPDIEFGWTMRIGDHWVRTDQTAFSTLHGNTSPQHDEDDFRYF